MQDGYLSQVKIYKALCDENRLMILASLKSGERCACTILSELDISQPTLSHHMKILIESGLVESRKDGRWTYYSLSEPGCQNAVESLSETLKRAEDYKLDCSCT